MSLASLPLGDWYCLFLVRGLDSGHGPWPCGRAVVSSVAPRARALDLPRLNTAFHTNKTAAISLHHYNVEYCDCITSNRSPRLVKGKGTV